MLLVLINHLNNPPGRIVYVHIGILTLIDIKSESGLTEFKCFPLSLFPGSDEDTDMASDFPLKERLVLLSVQYTLISNKITAVSQAAEIAKILVVDLLILSVQTGRGLNDRL